MEIGSPFTMVVLIVAIVFGTKLLRTRMLTRAERGRGDDQQISSAMQVQIDRLTDRVNVLEKLVTDDDRRLASEIDRLRDTGRQGVSY